jgi:hypothetical protein
MKRFARIAGTGAAVLLLLCLPFLPALAQVTPAITMNAPTGNAYIMNDYRIQVEVRSATHGAAQGTVTFDSSNVPGIAHGNFTSAKTVSLDANGRCYVDYQPQAFEAGTTTITATYDGSSDPNHDNTSNSASFTVVLRPTQTVVQCLDSTGEQTAIYVDEPGTVKIVVQDARGDVPNLPTPGGTLVISRTDQPGDGAVAVFSGTPHTTIDGAGTKEFQHAYVCNALGRKGDQNNDVDHDKFEAVWTPTDGIYATSGGVDVYTIQRRQTEMELSNCSGTVVGCQCTVTVTEKDTGKGLGSTTLGGDLDSTSTDPALLILGGYAGGPHTFTRDDDQSKGTIVMVAVLFDSTNGKHVNSSAAENVDREGFGVFTVGGGDCERVNISQMIMDNSAAVKGAELAKNIAATVQLITDPLPDPCIGLGACTTIPVSDIAAAILGTIVVACDWFIYSVTFDSDADSIPDNVERAAGLTEVTYAAGQPPTNGGSTSNIVSDSDGDGLNDAFEIDWAGGYMLSDGPLTYPNPVPKANTGAGKPGCACPGPRDKDSDDDGLYDGHEVRYYGTDPCKADTDGDNVPDGMEVATWSMPDVRDHADPLLMDTDGDGITDYWELPLGCGCANLPGHVIWKGNESLIRLNDEVGAFSTAWLNYIEAQFTWDPSKPEWDGYVNSDDSDGDGLPDGDVEEYMQPDLVAEPDPNKKYPGTAYVTLVADSGALKEMLGFPADPNGAVGDDLHSICDDDSDGDGLYDGFELLRYMDPHDWDTDNDGRCDGDEVLGYGPIPTDPFDIDTDDDGILDSTELYADPANPTNPVMADTDGDGLCDGGVSTPSGTGANNPLCRQIIVGSGSNIGIIDHPNPLGLGEDENGNGLWDVDETDPRQHDTDGDGVGDGVEKLGFSTSRQVTIPATDVFGRPITVTYPACGCMDPLDPDTDDDGLSDGYEDRNANGNFDFLPSDFDHMDPIPGPTMPDPEETNPCDADTDDDGLSDYDERYQPNPNAFYPFNRTNPLDHDTDNDRMTDGDEVAYVCVDPNFDLDPNRDGVDDYYVMGTNGGVLDPTNRDSDSDGYIDGLDPNPCFSDLLPYPDVVQDTRADRDGDGFADVVEEEAGTNPDDPNDYPATPEPEFAATLPKQGAMIDTDEDGFSDDDEWRAGTNPNDPADYPAAYEVELDQDAETIDRLWLEDADEDGTAEVVVIDIGSDILVDARLDIPNLQGVEFGDFDEDGDEDDVRYTVRYEFANGRFRHTEVTLIITDLNRDTTVATVAIVQ